MTACRDAITTVQTRWMPGTALGLVLLLNACAVAPPPTGGGDPRVPVVDATALGVPLRGMVEMPAPAPPAKVEVPPPAPPALPPSVVVTPEPTPTPESPPAPAPDVESKNLVLASSTYVPTVDWPLPEAAHSRALEPGWLAPLSPGASLDAVQERLLEALRGAGFSERWRLLPLPGAEGFMLVTAVERVAAGDGARWAVSGDTAAGGRYRSFVFQVGAEAASRRVLVYEAEAPRGNLAAFRGTATNTAVDHLKQAGILQTREILVFATAP